MGTGDPGHHGTRAHSPVVVVSKFESVSAMTPNQNTVEKSVLVMPKTSRLAITSPALLVRQQLYFSIFMKKMSYIVLV